MGRHTRWWHVGTSLACCLILTGLLATTGLVAAQTTGGIDTAEATPSPTATQTPVTEYGGLTWIESHLIWIGDAVVYLTLVLTLLLYLRT